MSDFPFQDWLEKTVNYSGVFACGVRLSNKSSSVRSYHESYPEARIGDLLQTITEVAFTLRNSQLGSARLRWVFENGQIHSARRPDGSIAVLATSKTPEAEPSVEELFTDFLTANSAMA
ncbi:MAG TPA: hypothetical protein VGO67_00095 [Verrucomicrobiae bacterium]|jgi:hypothetical protein